MTLYDLRQFRGKSVAELEAQAELLGRTTAPTLQFDDPKVAQENLQLLRFRPEIQAAAIYDARGAIFAKYAANAGQDRFPRLPESNDTRAEGGGIWFCSSESMTGGRFSERFVCGPTTSCTAES